MDETVPPVRTLLRRRSSKGSRGTGFRCRRVDQTSATFIIAVVMVIYSFMLARNDQQTASLIRHSLRAALTWKCGRSHTKAATKMTADLSETWRWLRALKRCSVDPRRCSPARAMLFLARACRYARRCKRILLLQGDEQRHSRPVVSTPTCRGPPGTHPLLSCDCRRGQACGVGG
ncbi:hypothetical protein BC567DRAFT_221935 [Phyllosticta citribraziliensis]